MSDPPLHAATTGPGAHPEWSPDGLEHVPSCPACGETGRTTLYADLTDRVFHAAPGTWSLARCARCRSAYLDPRPTAATIDRAYTTYYTHDDPPARPTPVRLNDIRRALANDHLRARWGYRVGPALPGGRVLGRLAVLRGASADREVRHLPARPGGRLLDVGSGSGAVVACMRELGWNAEGLDPDPAAIEVARRHGLPVTQGTLADIDDDAHADAYDAITLSHVIEHLHDPAGELDRIRRLLKPGGLLWVATPNLEALGHRRFGRDWLGLDPPRHLVLFTTASLEALLRRTGFEPRPTPVPAPIAWLSFTQSAAIRDGRKPEEGPASGRRRLRAVAWLADRLARRNPRLADELVAIGIRPA